MNFVICQNVQSECARKRTEKVVKNMVTKMALKEKWCGVQVMVLRCCTCNESTKPFASCGSIFLRMKDALRENRRIHFVREKAFLHSR